MAFNDLDSDDIVGIYWIGGRRGGWGRDVKGQGYGGRGCRMVSDLSQVFMLFGSGEGEKDLREGRVEGVCGELLQVTVEGVGEEEVKDWSRQQGEGGAKGQAKQIREIVWTCSEIGISAGKSRVSQTKPTPVPCKYPYPQGGYGFYTGTANPRVYSNMGIPMGTV